MDCWGKELLPLWGGMDSSTWSTLVSTTPWRPAFLHIRIQDSSFAGRWVVILFIFGVESEYLLQEALLKFIERYCRLSHSSVTITMLSSSGPGPVQVQSKSYLKRSQKMTQGWPRVTPGWPRMTAGWLQDDLGWLQDDSRMTSGWPRMTQGWLQDDSRMT